LQAAEISDILPRERLFVHKQKNMPILLADAHAHLDFPELKADQEGVIRRARDAGVALIINVGIGGDSSRQVLATAHQYPGVYATIGVHPHGVGALNHTVLEDLTPLAADPKVAAIGEIGLDFYRRRAPAELQVHWFREQLAWAFELKKIVVIHTREATAVTLQILREQRAQLLGGVMHCFAGSLEEACGFLDLGMFLSFAGPLTYPQAEPLRQVAKRLPLDRLLVETDCPFLAPQPWRGKRNEPAFVVATARQLADLHGLSLEETARQTWHNTLTAFGLEGKLGEEVVGGGGKGLRPLAPSPTRAPT
jgi:TatD DNase family protein